MAFTIEVERKERAEEFSFGDLELCHQECYGGEVVQEFDDDHGSWRCECTRCGCEIFRLSPKETILITQTAIDGQERKFDSGPYSPIVYVVQRGKVENLSPRLASASPNRDKQIKTEPEGLVLLEKEVGTMGNVSKWVTRKEAKWRDLLHSTTERRLVTIASGSPIEVIPLRDYRVPSFFFRRYDYLVFVNMGPKQVSVSMEGNAGTSDGVAVKGRVSVQVIIRNEESYIKRMAADPDEEERLLRDSILMAVQETTASHTWYEIMSIGEKFVQTAEQKLSELLNQTTSCFEVKSLTIQEICPQNKALAESLEKAAGEKEEEKFQRDLTHLRAERAVLERKAKEEELESELQMQSLRHQSELENEREKLKLQQEKDDAQISAQKKLSELLETEPGRMAALPRETFELLLRKVELEITDSKERQKLYRELLRFCLSPLSGEVRALKAFLTQQYGVRFSEESPMLPPGEEPEEEKETQQINDKSQNSNTTTELSDEENA